MEKDEIENELGMSYDELCDYLVGKYGTAKYNYFHTEECRAHDKRVTRTSEGLFCHHRREDFGGNLSNPGTARIQPFEWQQRENLVYCNIIEHLILHIKIAVLRKQMMLQKPSEIDTFFTTGGIFMICSEIVDYYQLTGTAVAWKKRCYAEVCENYSDFIDIINALFLYMESHYDGDKQRSRFLVPGQKVIFKDTTGEILKISPDSQKIMVKLKNGEEKSYIAERIGWHMSYLDYIEINLKRICTGYNTYYQEVYEDIMASSKETGANYCKLLEIDFKGYGFPQHTREYINRDEYGSRNVDEYLYRGLPSTYGNASDEVIDEKPAFWKGKIPKKIKENPKLNYIIRVNSAFCVKPGKKPFVRYKIYDFRIPSSTLDNDNNLAFKKGWILENSFGFNHITGKYDAKNIVKNGVWQPATLKITIAKADIPRFFETYDVEVFEVLDGCYWQIE